MPRQLIPPEPWWPQAADLMVRYDLSLREAAAELGVDLTIEQADAILKRKLFQKTLQEARTGYHLEIGTPVGSPRRIYAEHEYSRHS